VALDRVEHLARRRPLARLLRDVVLGLGSRVRLLELDLVGEAIELHVTASRAAHDVGERRAVPVRRGDQTRPLRRPGDREVRDQPARAAHDAPRLLRPACRAVCLGVDVHSVPHVAGA
jgi:hypothetical protein